MFRVRIRELRESAGYKSQQAFADAFGVAQTTVASWEGGTRMPSHATILRLADFFNVSIDYLLGHGDEKAISQKEDKLDVSSPASKENLQAAFWGGEKDLSQEDLDDMWNDVERFAAFLAEKKRQEKKDG